MVFVTLKCGVNSALTRMLSLRSRRFFDFPCQIEESSKWFSCLGITVSVHQRPLKKSAAADWCNAC